MSDEPDYEPDYAPEILPDLDYLAAVADQVANHALRLRSSGQRIVQDFRYQRENLVAEANTLEQERLEAIHQINRSYDAKLQRNYEMCGQVDRMIAHYTNEVWETSAVKPIAQHPKPTLFQRLSLRAA